MNSTAWPNPARHSRPRQASPARDLLEYDQTNELGNRKNDRSRKAGARYQHTGWSQIPTFSPFGTGSLTAPFHPPSSIFHPQLQSPNPHSPANHAILHLRSSILDLSFPLAPPAAAGLTAAEFAREAGVTEDAIRKYYRGTDTPRIDRWPRIARALGLKNAKDLLPDIPVE